MNFEKYTEDLLDYYYKDLEKEKFSPLIERIKNMILKEISHLISMKKNYTKTFEEDKIIFIESVNNVGEAFLKVINFNRTVFTSLEFDVIFKVNERTPN